MEPLKFVSGNSWFSMKKSTTDTIKVLYPQQDETQALALIDNLELQVLREIVQIAVFKLALEDVFRERNCVYKKRLDHVAV